MASVLMLCGLGIFAVMGALVLLTCVPPRRISEPVRNQLADIPPRSWQRHRVVASLSDGREVPKVYIAYGRYVNYSYGLRPRLRPKRIVAVRNDA